MTYVIIMFLTCCTIFILGCQKWEGHSQESSWSTENWDQENARQA